MIYAAVMLGPWDSSKPWHTASGRLPWLGMLWLLLVTLLSYGYFLAGLHAWAVLAGNKAALKGKGVKSIYQPGIYFGAARDDRWIAFTLSFIFANGSYILPSLSDRWVLLEPVRHCRDGVDALPERHRALHAGDRAAGLAWPGEPDGAQNCHAACLASRLPQEAAGV